MTTALLQFGLGSSHPTLLHPLSLLILSLSVLLLLKRVFFQPTKKNLHLPPSPPRLPILGNLHQVGTLPHRTLQSLARRHGPLMLLHLGEVPALVVSSANTARDIMKTHDLIFASRPDSAIARRLLYDRRDLSFAPYGEYWRQLRSICVLQLLSAKRVQSFKPIREEETRILLRKIEESSSGPEPNPIDLTEIMPSLTNDIICRVAFGRKYGQGDCGTRFKELLGEFVALLGYLNVADYIPWMGWVNYLTGLNMRVDRNFWAFDRFLDGVIDDHVAVGREKGDQGKGKEQMDLVDVLLEIQRNNIGGASLERDSMKAIILDMFAAGTDTTSTAIDWIMAELLRHPNVMKKVQDEVRGIFPSQSNITEDNLGQLHYLKAVIKETLRLHPPVPLLVPRESTEQVTVHGYDIPAKTRVIINAWAIGRDPALWERPDEFWPERCLNASIDFKGQDFELIPFGAGRRGCPGVTFAAAIIELVLASLMHKFDWALPAGARAEDLDLTEAPGLTIHRKSPLLVVATSCV